MAKNEKTHMEVHREQKERLKKLALAEERTMLVMFKLLLDKWEGKK